MFKCPSCGSEKIVNSVGPSGMIRTCRNPMCGGSLAQARYSWSQAADEFHTKEAVEAAQAKAAEPAPAPVQPKAVITKAKAKEE